MKLSVSNIAWSNEEDLEMYEYIWQNNFAGLEIAPTRIFEDNPYDNLEKAKLFSDELKNKYNIQISSMQSILFGRSERIFGDEAERNKLISYLKKAIDFASSINCSNLVFGSPKNRLMEDKKQYSIAIDFFNELGDYASQNNTVFSIEANPTIYGTNFINTTQEAFELANEVNSQGFMVNVDLGTIIQNNEDLKIISENINAINHIHISEPYLIPIQERLIHKQLAEILIAGKYHKYVSLEMKNSGNLNDVKSSMNYLKGIFQSE